MPRYICAVDAMCESVGLSHIVSEPHNTPPRVLCEADVDPLVWSHNISPKTDVCPRCLKKLKDMEGIQNADNL